MSSAKVVPRKTSFRHVMFADALNHRRRPVNLGPQPPRTVAQDTVIEPAEWEFISWLFEQAGLNAANYRSETLARRLPACLRFLRVARVNDARAALLADRSLLGHAIGALVIGVTSFFRDTQVFESLKNNVFPMVFEKHRTVRIWSVACSSGQEMYSIAMLLNEMGLLHRADLLGTDCRSDALRQASEGIYHESDLRSLPVEMTERYMSRSGGDWRVDARLRTVVRWRTADATQITEPGSWHLIFCRNMAMYLEPACAQSLWTQLHTALAPGGMLIAGKAERPSADEFAPHGPFIFRKNRG